MTPFAETWANAPVETDGNGTSNPPPEPGTYPVSVQDARAFTSKQNNEVMVVELRILDGPKEGYIFPVMHGFRTEGATKAAKALAAGLGVNVDIVSTLEELHHELGLTIGTYYEAVVKQNGEYRNCYINGRLTGAEVPVSDVPSDGVPTEVQTDDGEPLPW